jgi:hypothetical protein
MEKKNSHKNENVFCENKNPKIISEKQHFNRMNFMLEKCLAETHF